MNEIFPIVWWTLHTKDSKIPLLSLLDNMEITNTMVTGVCVSVVLILLALIVRFFLFPRLREKPRGVQNIVELIVESMQNYTDSKVGPKTGQALGPYLFTLVAFIAVNGLTELVGLGILRPAPSDLNETVAFALITFVLIRFFAYRKKGALGRLRDYLKPIPFIAPIKLVTDLAIPVSLACRMFGNLLGGLVIMSLLMGVVPVVVPAVASIYFTLFHTGMQAFIFITLSLAFIEEALE